MSTRQHPSEYSGAGSIGMMRLEASGWVVSRSARWSCHRPDGNAGSGSKRMPLGAPLWMAESRAPTRAPWRIRAASLTWRWQSAGKTVGSATALTSRMIRITTSSSISVKPPGVTARGDAGVARQLTAGH